MPPGIVGGADAVNGYLGNNVRPCVSGAPSCTPLTMVRLVMAGHFVVFGQADFGRLVWASCAFGGFDRLVMWL